MVTGQSTMLHHECGCIGADDTERTGVPGASAEVENEGRGMVGRRGGGRRAAGTRGAAAAVQCRRYGP